MPKFRKRPVVVESVQWFKMVDHPSVIELHGGWCEPAGREIAHGYWIITHSNGRIQVEEPDIFEATYERVE